MEIIPIIAQSAVQSNSEVFFFDMQENLCPCQNEVKGRSKTDPLSFAGKVSVSYADQEFQKGFFRFTQLQYINSWELVRLPVPAVVEPSEEIISWTAVYYFLTSPALKLIFDGLVHLACVPDVEGKKKLVYIRWGGQGLILRSYSLDSYSQLAKEGRCWLKLKPIEKKKENNYRPYFV